MPSVKIDNSGVYFLLGGRGQAILFVHGSGCDHTLWGSQFQDLKTDFSVAAIDLNGHGRSPRREGDALPTYVQDVLAVMDALKEPVFLVGHSLGGAVAQSVALEKPKNLAGLVLVGTGAKLRVNQQILDSIEKDFPEAVDLILSWGFKQPVDPALLQRAREQMLRNGQETLLRNFLACNSFNVMERLPQISVRTLVVCGHEDQLTPIKYSEYLKNQIPRAELHPIENAGHMVMLEQPAELNSIICNFCKTS